MARILHVEDISELAASLSENLGQKYEVTNAADLKTAKILLEEQQFDLLLLDVSLPDGSSFDFYEGIKSGRQSQVPVIFLTGQAGLPDRMRGLELGAQDYILKPFYVKELIMRIEMRLKQVQSQTSVFQCGDLKFDKDNHLAFLAKSSAQPESLNLTPNEYRILFLLASHKDEVISRVSIVENVWGSNIHITDKAVNSHISNIRRKIQDSSCKITADGKGYRLGIS